MIKVDIILPKICERVKSYYPIDFFAQNVVGQIYFSIASEFYHMSGIFIGCIVHKK